MIRRTFQLVPGVGPWRERDLWARGITSWDEFPPAGARPVLSHRLDDFARARIEEARAALAAHQLAKLGALIPAREHWRLYAEFEKEAAFFDVEADGVTVHVPTVVSLYDAGGLQTFIRGRNLEELPERIAASRLWISFNGSCFDLPVLRRHFGCFPEPELHLDLRFLCRRIGLRGGLKHIEATLGIARPAHLLGVGGLQAVAWATTAPRSCWPATSRRFRSLIAGNCSTISASCSWSWVHLRFDRQWRRRFFAVAFRAGAFSRSPDTWNSSLRSD
jgi:uncharacterized protein YprB with RNaseH-like and TPR domain